MDVSIQNKAKYTDNVLKFLLKLRNNTLSNLKNALKKLNEKQNGTKDQILLRLASKLATDTGRLLVKQFFKQELYHELYEVDLFQNGSFNNSVYQYYKNMIPQNLQYPQSQLPPENPIEPQKIVNQQQVFQSEQVQPTIFNDNSQIDDIIETSYSKPVAEKKIQKGKDDVEIQEQCDNIFNKIQQNNVQNRQQDQIVEIVQDQQICSDDANNLHKSLNIEKIHFSKNYPCVLDENLGLGSSQIYCHCDQYNSEVVNGQKQKLLQCFRCKRFSHENCLEENKKMKQTKIGRNLEYNCHQCQFMALDPLATPIATILRPFKISKLRPDQVQKQGFVSQNARPFQIFDQYFQQLNPRRPSKCSIRIQVRCIRLDGVGFEHCFPKYGFMQVNEPKNKIEYEIPAPPNDEKKRKDEIYDITALCQQGKNQINIYQTQKNHKNLFHNHIGHVAAIFLVKLIQPQDITNFIKQNRTESRTLSFLRYRQFFGEDNSKKDEIQMIENQKTEQVTINLADSITMLPINIPARGEVCTHLQCFDLETYFKLNEKSKRWQCPFCNKRSSYVMIDTYFQFILDEMKPLRDKVHDIDDKIIMYDDLSIVFTRDKGKFYKKFKPVLDNDSNQDQFLQKYEVMVTNNALEQKNMEKKEKQINQELVGSQDSSQNTVLGKRSKEFGAENHEFGKQQKITQDDLIELD